ncbi:MAG: hypothetical protein J7K72_02665 [Candidatus Aenigmarchaeota archaeon]|nr:hypothetical protein [Candidatus Aenigmarchaeota archaeon]
MKSKKGAIQLSLGFIITIVFAVVLLSLAITWLRSTITGISGLTVDLTQQAQSEIAKTFQNTQKNFAIWPSRYELHPGSELIMAAGIKNNDEEGRTLYFVINMKLTSTDANVDEDEVNTEWITVPQVATKIDPAATATRDIAVKVPSNAPQGSYLFDVYACYGTSASEAGNTKDCDINSPNLWSSPQPVTINVKG